MAITFTVNQAPSTGSVHVFTLIAKLKNSGWTQTDSSDATTRGAAQVTSGASGANGLGNTNAYVIVQDPGGISQISFQRGSTDQVWRMKYSISAKFTGGSPSATVTASATDETILMGGGTDASPSFVTWLNTNATYKSQFAADSSSPYGFYTITYPIGGGLVNSCLIADPLVLTDSLDTNPLAFIKGFATTSALQVACLSATVANGTSQGVICRLSSSFVCTPALTYADASSANAFPGGAGTNAFSNKDDGVPIVYARRGALGAPNGYKGISSWIRWNSVTRTTTDTFSVSTSKDYVNASDVRLPWDGTTVPSV